MPPTPAAKEKEALGPNQVLPEIKKRLADLQQAIRDARHIPPSQALLLSALIYIAPTDGEELVREILGPYLRDHPEEEKPR